MSEEKVVRAERAIGRILQVGVLASAAVILVGLVLLLATGSSGYPAGAFPSDPAQVLAGLAAGRPYAVISAGLLLLILTPVLRVGISVIVFVREKDRPFVGITVLVFLILVASFLLGKVE